MYAQWGDTVKNCLNMDLTELKRNISLLSDRLGKAQDYL